jgi:hypothetical protein
MNDKTYTLTEAMHRLGIRSANAFFQLERKYPHAFVIMKRGSGKDYHSRKGVLYHKATLDSFAERREYRNQGKP